MAAQEAALVEAQVEVLVGALVGALVVVAPVVELGLGLGLEEMMRIHCCGCFLCCSTAKRPPSRTAPTHMPAVHVVPSACGNRQNLGCYSHPQGHQADLRSPPRPPRVGRHCRPPAASPAILHFSCNCVTT